MPQLTDAIRSAIEACGRTRYRIAKESGVSAAQLSRLVNGKRGLSIEAAERLAAYLGLEIVLRPKTKRKAR